MQYKEVKPYEQGAGKKEQVGRMFDNIAHRYDFLNHFLSLGIDNRWRNRAIRLLAETGAVHVLDVATGTGDLALMAARRIPGLKIEAVDISNGMLDIGRLKAKKQGMEARIRFSTGDSEALPFEDNRFDAVMVAFGVRNFENLQLGLEEMHRVLRPGGMLIVLEFSKPRMFPVRQLFGLYFRFVLPLIGRLTSRDPKAYTYLFESVQAFPDYGDFTAIMEIAGFRANNYRPLSLGICSIYSGVK
jgi:demethylmenaquinone methyltransferase/2-methoxy-6-polyprenyl-1,4-benzoquinol methylase